MGLFGNKNRHDIIIKPNEKGFVIERLKWDTIKINAMLKVPDGYYFLIGKNGKVFDSFGAGEHFFSYANLPKVCRKYHIDKIKDGKQQSSFNANLYLVSLGTFWSGFKTYRKVEMGTRAYGFFSTKVYGEYSYKICDAGEFMQSLLNEFDYIRTGEAEDIVSSWVDEVVVDELERQNFIIEDVVANSPKITECLKARIEKLFKVAGLELVDFKITKYKLPKQYQPQSDAIMNATLNKTDIPALDDDIKDNSLKEENKEIVDNPEQEDGSKQPNATEQSLNFDDSQSSDGEAQDEINNDPQDEYVPFGNIEIESAGNLNNLLNDTQKTYVDLDESMVYNSKSSKTKRCIACGAENDINADHCILCGEKFSKDELF